MTPVCKEHKKIKTEKKEKETDRNKEMKDAQKGREICDPTYKRNITILPIAGLDICRRV